jgi:hypothetical protein
MLFGQLWDHDVLGQILDWKNDGICLVKLKIFIWNSIVNV